MFYGAHYFFFILRNALVNWVNNLTYVSFFVYYSLRCNTHTIYVLVRAVDGQSIYLFYDVFEVMFCFFEVFIFFLQCSFYKLEEILD
jgi:hypothetical protein